MRRRSVAAKATPEHQRGRPPAKRWPVRWLLLAVGVLLAGTLALGLLLSRAAAVVAAKDKVIAVRVAPSIVALQAMRKDVQQEHALADEWVLGLQGDTRIRGERMDELRRDMARNCQDYLALTPEPTEAALRGGLVSSLHRFESLVELARARPPTAEASRSELLHQLDDSVGDIGRALAHASEVSADVASTAAGETEGVSQTLLPLALVLGVVTATAAVGTIVLTYVAASRAEKLEEAARQALERRADELDAFAGRVAHDLLSPLTAVSLALDLARRAVERDSPGVTTAVLRATATLQRVRGFVLDLLEFARAAAGPPPGVHAQVGEVVRDVVGELEPIARDAGVELQVETVPDREVRCSPGVLTSLLSNLVQNAIKYIAPSEIRRVVVRGYDLGQEVRVEVADTGPGIPPPDQERIFEPFARGRSATGPGLGIGLATVRRLAEAHGGHAGVLSEVGRGSAFWFSLPRSG